LLVKVLEDAVIGSGLLDDPKVCELLTLYVPIPPDPVPNPDIMVLGRIIPFVEFVDKKS
jgi:hypothetical protein